LETRASKPAFFVDQPDLGPAVAAILTDAFCGMPGYLCGMNARAFRYMAIPASCSFSRAARLSAALVTLLAAPL
jgi:hypothetical protein